MKNIILLALCALSSLTTAKAQDYFSRFVFTTKNDCSAAVADILETSGGKFEYTYLKTEEAKYFLLVDYKRKDTLSVPVTFSFRRVMKGANPDLEITGDTTYVFYSIVGRFLDVFPVWKSHIDPQADQDSIITRGRTEIWVADEGGKTETRYDFYKIADGWRLYKVMEREIKPVVKPDENNDLPPELQEKINKANKPKRGIFGRW